MKNLPQINFQNLAKFSTKFIYEVGGGSDLIESSTAKPENKNVKEAIGELKQNENNAEAKAVVEAFIKSELVKVNNQNIDADLIEALIAGLSDEDSIKNDYDALITEISSLSELVETTNVISSEITSPEELSGNIQEGTEISVKFATSALERGIGMADLLSNKIDQVEVFGINGESLGVASRKSLKGGFHYEDGGYAKILDGYTIKLKKQELMRK